MSYFTLNDPVTEDRRAYYSSGGICAKFCNMGIVTSSKWFSCYVVILDGVLTLYADEQSSLDNPQDPVLKINLSKYHGASAIKRKNYSQDPLKIIDFYCFYVQLDNGMFNPTKELKIGCTERSTADKLIRAIEINTRRIDPNIV
eukprot:gene28909-37929_t